MNVIEGKMTQDGIKVGIVVARFNEFITSKLLGGAKDGLVRHDVPEENIDVAWVPGAFEIPLIAKKMAKSGKYDAIICLGAVIRGATSHYDYVCNEVSKGNSNQRTWLCQDSKFFCRDVCRIKSTKKQGNEKSCGSRSIQPN